MSKKPHKARAHSRLAPSKASTWTVCTASVQLIDKLEAQGKVQEEQSIYAEEGTKAHEVCEALFKGTRIPHDPSNEMLDHCKAFVKYCRFLKNEDGAKECSEIDVPLFYLNEDTGAVDFLLILPKEKHIHIVDLKYGAGNAVSAVRNKQLSIYARSAIEEHVKGVDSKWGVSLHIYQPRTQQARDTGIPFTRWDLSWDQLSLFTEKEIAVPAHLILSEANHLLKFAPGDDTCKWCPAKGDCAARTRWLLDGTPIIPLLDGKEYTADLLTDEEKLNLFEKSSDIRDLLKSVEAGLWKAARNGTPAKGTKLVTGRGSREWRDEKKAEDLLVEELGKEAFTQPVLISVAQAEEKLKAAKLLDEKKFRDFYIKEPGQPILALADDKRREWQDVKAEDEFEDEDLKAAIDDAV